MQPDPPAPDAPKRHLAALQATALALGMIMSTDTLKTAPTVAQSLSGPLFYGAWIAGGLVSMVGAFCYVEMATAFPDPGGDYHFLRRAWGREVGALFAWSRFSVMHTGWMALMAFMFADYAGDLLGLGHGARTLFALGVIAVLMALNLAPARRGFAAQVGLVVLVAFGFAAVVAAAVALGLLGQLPPAVSAIHTAGLPTLSKLTVAFVYIFLAFGGWSDAATLSAEVSDKARGMLIAIVGSLTLLIAIYLALNAAMMVGLGPAALAASDAPAADLMGRAFGPAGKAAIVAVVGVSAIASINSTLIVGARTTYAAARDIPRLSFIGRWDGARGVPARAVVVESLFAMALVVAGGFAKSGFNAMVDYMTPIYWLFIALSMGALVRLRLRHPDAGGAVRTPFFPLFPLAFMALALAMLAGALTSLGAGALYGAAVMGVGAALLAGVRMRGARALKGA